MGESVGKVSGNLCEQVVVTDVTSLLSIFHESGNGGIALSSCAQVLSSRGAKVCAHEVTSGRHYGVVNVELHIFIIVGLVIGASALSVHHSEVGVQVHGLGQRVEQCLEVFQRGTYLKSTLHQGSVAVGIDTLWAVEVVSSRVDDGKSRLVVPAPGAFLSKVGGIDKSQITVSLALEDHG